MKAKLIARLQKLIIDIVKASNNAELDQIASELAEIEKKLIALDKKKIEKSIIL